MRAINSVRYISFSQDACSDTCSGVSSSLQDAQDAFSDMCGGVDVHTHALVSDLCGNEIQDACSDMCGGVSSSRQDAQDACPDMCEQDACSDMCASSSWQDAQDAHPDTCVHTHALVPDLQSLPHVEDNPLLVSHVLYLRRYSSIILWAFVPHTAK